MQNDYMWEFNIGFSLGSMHSYYEKESEPFVLSRAKNILKKYTNVPQTSLSAKALYDRIKNWSTPDLADDKEKEYDNTEESAYNKWVNEHYLRLNLYNDVNPVSVHSQEDSFFFNGIFSPKDDMDFGKRQFQLLNEIKQEYVSARYMLYYYLTGARPTHYSDKNVKLADMYDLSNYSFYLESAKAAFRALYSLLDKIAFALNDYLKLGIPEERVSFNKMWYDGKHGFTIRKEILKYDTLINLAGLLFIRNDIFGGDEYYLQAEETKLLNKVRNAMEHWSVIIVDDAVVEDSKSILTIGRKEFESVAMNLIKTIRQAIFCYVNAVNHIEYDKKQVLKKKSGIVMPQEYGMVEDGEKV